jgi:hypothetical protein
MRIGFDFDNTLISYDKLFHRVASDKGLLVDKIPELKNSVRDYLREKNQEEVWTRLQGEVYGNRILEAEAFHGMKSILKELSNRGLPMYIVSHKTRKPYLGKQYDLHNAARDWLKKQGFFDSKKTTIPKDNIFFEITKEAKIEKICSLRCTHYIDDLPEILEMLPDNIDKILFSPSNNSKHNVDWKIMSSWEELPTILEL